MKLVITVGGCFFVAALGSRVTLPSIPTWYATLAKPSFNPPGWIFGPVWTALFLLMGISAYLVWKKGESKKIKSALLFFIAQLSLNFLWSLFFFGWHRPVVALVDIILLEVAILMTMNKFRKISKLAAFLLIPYLAWVSFASILNLAIVILN